PSALPARHSREEILLRLSASDDVQRTYELSIVFHRTALRGGVAEGQPRHLTSDAPIHLGGRRVVGRPSHLDSRLRDSTIMLDAPRRTDGEAGLHAVLELEGVVVQRDVKLLRLLRYRSQEALLDLAERV